MTPAIEQTRDELHHCAGLHGAKCSMIQILKNDADATFSTRKPSEIIGEIQGVASIYQRIVSTLAPHPWHTYAMPPIIVAKSRILFDLSTVQLVPESFNTMYCLRQSLRATFPRGRHPVKCFLVNIKQPIHSALLQGANDQFTP